MRSSEASEAEQHAALARTVIEASASQRPVLFAREGVTDAAGKLQKLGIIRYARGQITVLERAQLEHLSCECYAVVKRESDRLLPARPSPGAATTPAGH